MICVEIWQIDISLHDPIEGKLNDLTKDLCIDHISDFHY